MTGGFLKTRVHPGQLTWNLGQTLISKKKIMFQTSIIVFHVNFPRCKSTIHANIQVKWILSAPPLPKHDLKQRETHRARARGAASEPSNGLVLDEIRSPLSKMKTENEGKLPTAWKTWDCTILGQELLVWGLKLMEINVATAVFQLLQYSTPNCCCYPLLAI